jgi:elongation factor P
MKINGNTIRSGNVIEHKGRLWVATKTQHTQPGKGGAYMQVELKDVRDGTKLNERFRAGEQVERARLDEAEYQYLFQDGEQITFMNNTTYDQLTLSSQLLGHSAAFLQDGMSVILNVYDSEIVSVTLPDTVVMMISEADPVVKGQTAASSYKPAKLENGVRNMVPPHVESGDRIVVSTTDGSYIERAKN